MLRVTKSTPFDDEEFEDEEFHDPFDEVEDDDEFDDPFDDEEDDEFDGDFDEDDLIESPNRALYASDSDERHHLLPWYKPSSIREITARQGMNVIEAYPSYFTESDIVMDLLEKGHEGKFRVYGKGPNGKFLPDSAEITVRPKTKLTSFLEGSSHVRANKNKGGDFDASILLEHESERQRELDNFRREEVMRHEEMLREQREADERRLRERQNEMDRLRERQLELERSAAQEARELASKRIEEQRAAAKDQVSSIQRMTEHTLQQMQMLFQQKAESAELSATRQEQTLTGAFSSQIAMLKGEIDHWKRRAEDMERRYQDRDEDARRRETEVRERSEREISKAKEYAEEKVRDIEREYRRREEDLTQRMSDRERYLTDKKEDLRQEVENLRESIRGYEMKMMEMGFKVKEATSQGPSRRAAEIKEIASVAQAVGVDPASVFRNELGYAEAEKRSTLDGLVEQMLPMLAGAFTSKGSGGTTQVPALPSSGGSLQPAAQPTAAGGFGQTEKL